MDILDLILGVVGFTAIVLVLVLIILAARSQLVSTGAVSIEINGDSDNPITVPSRRNSYWIIRVSINFN